MANFYFRFWLYGDKVNCEERMRGWFPRKCAIEFIYNGRIKESKKSSEISDFQSTFCLEKVDFPCMKNGQELLECFQKHSRLVR